MQQLRQNRLTVDALSHPLAKSHATSPLKEPYFKRLSRTESLWLLWSLVCRVFLFVAYQK
jgi:hypothetical protein